MFKDLCINDFLQQLASKNATPGGGTASAISGAMGASLIAMFCNLTASKKKYVDVKEEMEAIAKEAEAIRDRLLQLADEDSNSYIGVMNAFKLPKETDEDKEIRAAAIEKASQKATEVPLETAISIIPLLEKVPNLAKKGNPNAMSDLKVGLEACYTGFVGAAANVEINLPGLTDEVFVAKITEKFNSAKEKAQRLVEEGRNSI